MTHFDSLERIMCHIRLLTTRISMTLKLASVVIERDRSKSFTRRQITQNGRRHYSAMTSSSYQAVNATTTTAQARHDSLAPPQLQDEIVSCKKQLTPVDAIIHLVKGNLGPGCLNLPHAFALVGWALGSGLFVLVALQGIYSMRLLLYCKTLLTQRNDNLNINTFMDVARAALGSAGGRIVEIFLFVLQGGVCCVFLSLISTNLTAAVPNLSANASVLIVTLGLMVMVLLRSLKDLFWLCATANLFMVVAILTATIAGLMNYVEEQPTNIVVANATPSSIITFTADMFFAFEGIGLVLPVENSFGVQQRSFVPILIGSMSLVATLFVLVGVSASIGFPDIRSGSVTAYLERDFPEVIWYSIVNYLVIIAVAFTFPLQLTPAMEVLDQWLDGLGVLPPDNENESNPTIQLTPSTQEKESFQDEEASTSSSIPSQQSCCSAHTWIFRRWAMVLLYAGIVLVVNDLGVLMSLFGAVGQTGLAGMPCAVHLALQYQGIAPKSTLWSVVNVLILVFCTVVMLAGCFLVAKELIEKV